jgi:hypothetical protein
MPHNPKLEIFRIKLIEKETSSPITFRKFFGLKYNYAGRKDERTITNNDTSQRFFKDFIASIDKKYYVNEKKKKSFKVSNSGATLQDGKLIPLFDKFVFRGTISGGAHGRHRTLGDINQVDPDQKVGKNHVIADSFYFLLHTPIDHNEGVVLIQGYTGASISDVFRSFIEKYFSIPKKYKSEISPFVPKSLKDRYLDEAVFKSVQFDAGWIIDEDLDEEHPKAKKYELQIKIEIIDVSEHETRPKLFKKLTDSLGKFILKRGEEEHELNKYKRTPKMQSGGKTQRIDFSNLANIKPVLVFQPEEVKIKDGLVPDFNDVDKFCKKLLPEIMNEIYPSNDIQDL